MITMDELEELAEYSEIEGTSLGDSWKDLIAIYRHASYFSTEFSEAISKEIKGVLTIIKEKTRVVKYTEERRIVHNCVELEWID